MISPLPKIRSIKNIENLNGSITNEIKTNADNATKKFSKMNSLNFICMFAGLQLTKIQTGKFTNIRVACLIKEL